MTVMTQDSSPRGRGCTGCSKTKAGIALGYTALLGLLVGAVVTSQTLYAATTASAKEYAILLAMGIPRAQGDGDRARAIVLGRAVRHRCSAYPTVHCAGARPVSWPAW